MSEQPGRDRHRWKTLLLRRDARHRVRRRRRRRGDRASALDEIGFLRFPLGFYLLAQGLLIGIVAACFWSTRVQERIDTALGETEEA